MSCWWRSNLKKKFLRHQFSTYKLFTSFSYPLLNIYFSFYRYEVGLLPYKSTQPNDEYYPFLFIKLNLGIPLEYVDKYINIS